MTRSELVTRIAKQFPQLTRVDIELSLKVVMNEISDHLAQGGRVEIRDFGAFSVHIRPPRQARNPRTGEPVSVPPKRVVHFKPGVGLRARINTSPATSYKT